MGRHAQHGRARPRRSSSLLLLACVAALTLAACKKPEPKTRAVGDRLKSFVVKNVDSGQQYCQVCAFAGKPIIIAIAELGDPRLEATLVGIQRVLEAQPTKGVKAFAVLGRLVDGALQPPEDEAKAVAELRALRQKLGLAFPLTVLPKTLTTAERETYARFADAYELLGTPTVYLANLEDEVVWAGVLAPERADAELAKLTAAVQSAL